MLFKYNSRTYVTKGLKGGHTYEDFAVLLVCLNDKMPFMKVSSGMYLKIFSLYQHQALQP